MNSLQYISTHVDSLIGNTPPSSPIEQNRRGPRAGEDDRDLVGNSTGEVKSWPLSSPLAVTDEQQRSHQHVLEEVETSIEDEKSKALTNSFPTTSGTGQQQQQQQQPSSTSRISSRGILSFIASILSFFIPRRSYFSMFTFFLYRYQDSTTATTPAIEDDSFPTTVTIPTDEARRYHKSTPSIVIGSDHKRQPSSNRLPVASTISSFGRLLLPPISRPLLSKSPALKTLVLDLDETLIHSLSRTSKFSSNQMVEVKLDNSLPTLYYINKRPYCDVFLEYVSQWYNLVIFTASVQQYADPVIDWLEQNIRGKYFKKRFYRNDCVQSSVGYIKDLSLIQTDLSKIIIIDNSPVSYTYNPDNAIGIKGWISDPTDLTLLHLIPVLDSLRFSHDVRSILSLKSGEAAFDSTSTASS